MIKENDKVVEVDGEFEDNTGKDAEMTKKVTPKHKPPPFLSSMISEKDCGW